MSRIHLSLRLRGKLPPLDDITQILGIVPTDFLRCGDIVGKRRIQPMDVWILDLAEFDTFDDDEEHILSQTVQAATTLEQLVPALATLDRTNCEAELYISNIQEEDQGGFSLPKELLAVAADGKLSLEFSILVMLDDYEEPEKATTLTEQNQ
jgi:Domain of unknown function (DUF4279)